MALSFMEFRRQLIHKTGCVSWSSAQCHVVPGVALAVFPNSLHVYEERQSWFALEEREAYPGHQGQHLQTSQQRNEALTVPSYGDISNESKIICLNEHFYRLWYTFQHFYVMQTFISASEGKTNTISVDSIHVSTLGPSKHYKLALGCPWLWELLLWSLRPWISFAMFSSSGYSLPSS